MIGSLDILAARILVVDDQASNVALFQHLLAQAGYVNVTATQHPAEVLKLHQTEPFDLILLDLVMPDMDGFEVMKQLQDSGGDPYLPVIVLTAEPAHKLQALQAGAKDFLSRPFDLLEVKTRIHNMLEVRLLYKALNRHNEALEDLVAERTAELSASELRFRSLTELASDWYWEQNETGEYTTVSGPVAEIMGLRVSAFLGNDIEFESPGWDESERQALNDMIATRQPFHDFPFSRRQPDGSMRHFKVSGEPMFNTQCRFVGFRGLGAEVKTLM